jgi:hypothetical protein
VEFLVYEALPDSEGIKARWNCTKNKVWKSSEQGQCHQWEVTWLPHPLQQMWWGESIVSVKLHPQHKPTTSVVNIPQDKIRDILQNIWLLLFKSKTRDWRHGSRGRAPALQVQSPEFKSPSHLKKM